MPSIDLSSKETKKRIFPYFGHNGVLQEQFHIESSVFVVFSNSILNLCNKKTHRSVKFAITHFNDITLCWSNWILAQDVFLFCCQVSNNDITHLYFEHFQFPWFSTEWKHPLFSCDLWERHQTVHSAALDLFF